MKRFIRKLKAIIRDWAFADSRWITRAQIRREIAAKRWEYRDHLSIVRILDDLHNSLQNRYDI